MPTAFERCLLEKQKIFIHDVSLSQTYGDDVTPAATVGTCLLEALCGRQPYSGQVTLNGLEVGRRELARTCAVVRRGTVLHGDLSVAASLRYYAALRRPPGTRGKLSMADQVKDLGRLTFWILYSMYVHVEI